MGVGVDDVHHMRMSADPPAFPGVAWIEVFASSRAPEQLCEALARGSLYSSTGPVLRSIGVTEQEYAIEAQGTVDAVEFIGSHGQVLSRHDHPRGMTTYRLKGNEVYVRARVTAGTTTAWTPAIRVISR